MIKKINNNTLKTLLIVFLLCLVCSIIVTTVSVNLKSKQEEQIKLDVQKNILNVSGLLKYKMTQKEIKEIYNKYIEKKFLNFKTNKLYTINNFNLKKELNSDKTSIKLSSNEDIAKIHRRANFSEIYLVKNNTGDISQIILPIYGSGLWSIMYAFISINSDGITSNGITFYEHGETPGLGGEVDNQKWKKQWKGKKLFNNNGKIAIKIIPHNTSNNIYNIDSLSGATLTSNGIQHILDFWLGDKGFGPFLKKVQKGEFKNV
ncbi:Na(+)-translocating NADH-quinone reductase subunit C [Candidatus Providencia siddallii]|uniref:Na(+)-translocating NADH-quinone reductase subunit C n=2 Tax=Candidatus Providencia siddallii TaxID=1715285 RepID=A0ABP1CHX7_9GAMM